MRDIEDYTRRYGEMPFEDVQAAYRRRVVLEQVARHQPRRLLEIGCGLAPLFTDLAPDMDICVVEPSAEFIAHARGFAQGRDRVRLVQALLEDFVQGEPGTFDFISLSGLLHEVESPAALLAATRRICHDGTLVHMNVPNAHSLHRLLALEMGLIASPFELSAQQKTLQQHSTFDLPALARLAKEAGFSVLESDSYFIKPFTHAQMEALRRSGFLTDAMLEGFHGLARHLPGLGSEIYLNARIRPL
ncbi:class I SAM-dependent methyltransferase [Metapseudomonas furukawaii]|uniref:class I SAM-dependent methyltransferase n=1 Tax=Metapseudomonas furukawaii TaxID=1149133 RepID=UPI00227CE7F7|nr:class I SAM-dependent methyltransferase [Pseudomonas furukawaii]WAG77621.1 class I SAM-dependent methyltransferase [Pseudomonas furukawaii]